MELHLRMLLAVTFGNMKRVLADQVHYCIPQPGLCVAALLRAYHATSAQR